MIVLMPIWMHCSSFSLLKKRLIPTLRPYDPIGSTRFVFHQKASGATGA